MLENADFIPKVTNVRMFAHPSFNSPPPTAAKVMDVPFGHAIYYVLPHYIAIFYHRKFPLPSLRCDFYGGRTILVPGSNH